MDPRKRARKLTTDEILHEISHSQDSTDENYDDVSEDDSVVDEDYDPNGRSGSSSDDETDQASDTDSRATANNNPSSIRSQDRHVGTTTIREETDRIPAENEPDIRQTAHDNHIARQQPAAADGERPTVRRHKRTGVVLTRKRQRDPSTWKQNVRKTLRQSGQRYTDSRGKVQGARSVKTKKDCSKCKFKCSLNISETDRLAIFNDFWKQSDDEKLQYFARTTVEEPTSRKTKKDDQQSRRGLSRSYFFPLGGGSQRIRVCQFFFLTTLDINHKRVARSRYHDKKHEVSGTPARLQRGEAANNVVAQEIKDGMRMHLRSIPRVESHYCRAQTNKEYLPSGYNLVMLYEKYVEQCNDNNKTPGKQHIYRQIFNNEFNYAFHVPKKDRCDACEAMKNNESPTDEEKKAHEEHVKGKQETKAERDRDRNDKNKFTVCFDLQNVFALPTADISNFFYRRKLNVYHMTAHCSINKKGYGSIWNEAHNGRAGNDIASSVMKVLDAVVEENADDHRVKHITLWSDSCVPQNRNSIFSTAIQVFLKDHPQIHSIEHKFCQPGHSSIQEVDNLHSQIEAVSSGCEIYSPVGLMRTLKKVGRSKPMKLIQMRSDDFKDFGAIAGQGQFHRVPFTKVKSLLFYRNEPKVIKYKTNFSDDWTSVNVLDRKSTRGNVTEPQFIVQHPAVAKPSGGLSEAKKADIRQMLKYMPLLDKTFMSNLV